jgi:hypothetical protein
MHVVAACLATSYQCQTNILLLGRRAGSTASPAMIDRAATSCSAPSSCCHAYTDRSVPLAAMHTLRSALHYIGVRGQERSRCSRANKSLALADACMPSGEPRSQAKQPGFSRHVAIHANKARKLTNNMIRQRRYGSVGRADDRRASATTPLLLLRAIVSVRSSGGV